MKKLGYIRTSTDKQTSNRQIDQLRHICDHVYVEDGVSAVGKNRPVYNEVISNLVTGDIFVVVSLDRAYRSVIDALVELDKIQRMGVEFCSLTQNFDTRTPEGKLLYTVSAALAEWERAILSQRTRDGMQAARRRGSKIGRPRKLTPEQINEAQALHKQADAPNINIIAQQFNVSETTMRRALGILNR